MPILAATAATWRCVIRLDAAYRNQRIGAGCNRVRDDVFELADLVAAERETGIAVLPAWHKS